MSQKGSLNFAPVSCWQKAVVAEWKRLKFGWRQLRVVRCFRSALCLPVLGVHNTVVVCFRLSSDKCTWPPSPTAWHLPSTDHRSLVCPATETQGLAGKAVRTVDLLKWPPLLWFLTSISQDQRQEFQCRNCHSNQLPGKDNQSFKNRCILHDKSDYKAGINFVLFDCLAGAKFCRHRTITLDIQSPIRIVKYVSLACQKDNLELAVCIVWQICRLDITFVFPPPGNDRRTLTLLLHNSFEVCSTYITFPYTSNSRQKAASYVKAQQADRESPALPIAKEWYGTFSKAQYEYLHWLEAQSPFLVKHVSRWDIWLQGMHEKVDEELCLLVRQLLTFRQHTTISLSQCILIMASTFIRR